MIRKILSMALAAIALAVLSGCATTQQVACKLSETKTVYTDTAGDCQGLIQALRRQQPGPVAVPGAPAGAANPPQTAASGCGVRLSGILIKEIVPRPGSSCEADRKLFVAKFLAECRGKNGSDAADITCGRKLSVY